MNSNFTPGPWRRGTGGASVVCDTEVPEINSAHPGNLENYGGHLIAESIAPRNAALIAAAPDLLDCLRALMTNEHVNLGDLVYAVRDRELQGWDGPSVKAWSDAVTKAADLIAKLQPKAEEATDDGGKIGRPDRYTPDWRTRTHPNGARMFADDGTMLDHLGKRSIFDDVDE